MRKCRNEKSNSDLKRLLKFQDSVRYGPIFVCSSCHQTMFQNSVSAFDEVQQQKIKEEHGDLFDKVFGETLIEVEINEIMDTIEETDAVETTDGATV